MLDISSGMGVDRAIEEIMYFVGTRVRVTAKGVNFEAEGAAGQDIDPAAFEGRERWTGRRTARG